MVTQEQVILRFLKDYPEGVHPTTIVSETGILQYNARINGLRQQFHCIHKHKNDVCAATEHIINKSYKNGTTKFFYVKTKDSMEEYFREKRERKARLDAQIRLF